MVDRVSETGSGVKVEIGEPDGPTLPYLVRLVHLLRLAHAGAKEELDRRRKLWEEQNAEWIEQVRLCAADLQEAEAELREAALECYYIAGDTRPAPGVQVKLMTRVEYDRVAALEWAVKHQMFLKLDERSFESFARNRTASAGIPSLKVRQEPVATIATDLGKVLEGSAVNG